MLHAATETIFLATFGTNSAKSLATDFATTLPGFCESELGQSIREIRGNPAAEPMTWAGC